LSEGEIILTESRLPYIWTYSEYQEKELGLFCFKSKKRAVSGEVPRRGEIRKKPNYVENAKKLSFEVEKGEITRLNDEDVAKKGRKRGKATATKGTA